MKKQVLSVAALALVSMSAFSASSVQAEVNTSDGVRGADPRPQGVRGADPRPQGIINGIYTAFLALFGM